MLLIREEWKVLKRWSVVTIIHFPWWQDTCTSTYGWLCDRVEVITNWSIGNPSIINEMFRINLWRKVIGLPTSHMFSVLTQWREIFWRREFARYTKFMLGLLFFALLDVAGLVLITANALRYSAFRVTKSFCPVFAIWNLRQSKNFIPDWRKINNIYL